MTELLTNQHSFSYNDNKQALSKGCFSPFHISEDMTNFLFSIGGEWVFTPNKGKTAKGAKFTKPIKLSNDNINCKIDNE